MSDGTREASEKLLTFSGMCFLELDDPGDQPSANLDFGNSQPRCCGRSEWKLSFSSSVKKAKHHEHFMH